MKSDNRMARSFRIHNFYFEVILNNNLKKIHLNF